MGVRATSWAIVLNDYDISSFLVNPKSCLFFISSILISVSWESSLLLTVCFFSLLCVWRGMSEVRSSWGIWMSCILFLTEDNTTFWDGRAVDHTWWCLQLAPVFWASLWHTYCCTHSTYQRWCTRCCQLVTKLYASWNFPRNFQLWHQWANGLSTGQNSWLIDDSDVSNAFMSSGNYNREQSLESSLAFYKDVYHCFWTWMFKLMQTHKKEPSLLVIAL